MDRHREMVGRSVNGEESLRKRRLVHSLDSSATVISTILIIDRERQRSVVSEPPAPSWGGGDTVDGGTVG